MTVLNERAKYVIKDELSEHVKENKDKRNNDSEFEKLIN
jgi:DNA-binding FrmR family transcriptional regulator